MDILGNIMSVRLFAARKEEQGKLAGGLSEYVKADQKRDWFFLKMNAFQGGSFVVYQGIVLLWLIQGFRQETVSPGDFVLILTLNVSIIDFLWAFSKDMMAFAELTGTIAQGLKVVFSRRQIRRKGSRCPQRGNYLRPSSFPLSRDKGFV